MSATSPDMPERLMVEIDDETMRLMVNAITLAKNNGGNIKAGLTMVLRLAEEAGYEIRFRPAPVQHCAACRNFDVCSAMGFCRSQGT